MKLKTTLMGLTALALVATVAPAQAAVNLVQNGGFETTTLKSSSQFGSAAAFLGGTAARQAVANWKAGGYTMLYMPGDIDQTGGADSTFGANTVELWGSNNGGLNVITSSPNRGNFVAIDPVFRLVPLTQVITGLTVGQRYKLNFSYAGAQQVPYLGATTEGWQVDFGTQTYNTTTLNNVSKGFTGWYGATTIFTASSATQTLSFLATGGPRSALPPFSLLDGVSLTAGVPEPATWAMMIIGFAGVGAAIRRRRTATSAI